MRSDWAIVEGKLLARSYPVMPMVHHLDYRILPKDNLFVVRSPSTVTFEDIIAHVVEVMNDTSYHTGLNGLYDFSRVQEIEGDVSVFLQTASAMNDHSVIDKPARTAILVAENDDFNYGIFKGYVIMTQQSLIEYRLFKPSQQASMLDFLKLTSMPNFD